MDSLTYRLNDHKLSIYDYHESKSKRLIGKYVTFVLVLNSVRVSKTHLSQKNSDKYDPFALNFKFQINLSYSLLIAPK